LLQGVGSHNSYSKVVSWNIGLPGFVETDNNGNSKRVANINYNSPVPTHKPSPKAQSQYVSPTNNNTNSASDGYTKLLNQLIQKQNDYYQSNTAVAQDFGTYVFKYEDIEDDEVPATFEYADHIKQEPLDHYDISALGAARAALAHNIRAEDLGKPEAIAEHVSSIAVCDSDYSDNEEGTDGECQSSATPYTDATRPKKAAKKDHIKRPLNAFMLWAKEQRNLMREKNADLHNALISKHLGKVWKELDKKVRDLYKAKADKLKLLHEKEFPGYKYQPRKNKNKKATARTESGRVVKPTAKSQESKSRGASRPRKSSSSSSGSSRIRKGKSAQPLLDAAASPDSLSLPTDNGLATGYVQFTSMDQLLQQQQQQSVALGVSTVDSQLVFTSPSSVNSAQFVFSPAVSSSPTSSTDHLRQRVTITGGVLVAENASVPLATSVTAVKVSGYRFLLFIFSSFLPWLFAMNCQILVYTSFQRRPFVPRFIAILTRIKDIEVHAQFPSPELTPFSLVVFVGGAAGRHGHQPHHQPQQHAVRGL
jgi:hypothetical protein